MINRQYIQRLADWLLRSGRGAEGYTILRNVRGAFIEDISMNDLEVSGAKLGFLRFNILNSGIADEFLVPDDEGIRNFGFTNIRVTDMATLVDGSVIHPEITPRKKGFSPGPLPLFCLLPTHPNSVILSEAPCSLTARRAAEGPAVAVALALAF